MRNILSLSLVALMLTLSPGRAQTVNKAFLSSTSSKPDYQRAKSFGWDSLYHKTYRLSVHPHWFKDNSGFAYKIHTRKGTRFYTVSLSDLKKHKTFDRQHFAEIINRFTGDTLSAESLSLQNMQWFSKNKFAFSLKNKRYRIDLKENQLEALSSAAKDTSISPNGRYKVFIKRGNLYLKNLKDNRITALSSDGSKSYSYGSAYGWGQVMTGEDAAPKPRLKVVWSPDSKKLLTQISDTRDAKKMYMLNWFTDSLYRPELLSYYRPSPGDTAFVKLIPVVFDVQTHQMVRIDLKPTPQMVDLGLDLHWAEDSKHLVGTYDRRGFKKKDIIDVNPQTGKVTILYTDSSQTSVDYHTRFRFVEKENSAVLTSEKSGWKQLYLLDWGTGKLRSITHGNFVVREIKAVDRQQNEIYFTAAGREKEVNPYYKMLYKIKFDGSGLTLLTPEPADHETSLSPDCSYFVDNLSTPEKPTVTLLRDTENGEILRPMEKADVKDLKTLGWQPPQVFTATARDGRTTLYGALWKPTDFDPAKKYPLVDYTYTGPHTNVFPNTFSKGLYGLYDSAQSLAELGFIVMQVDGMGSNGRSKAFRDVSYGNLGNNLKDHALAIKQLGEKYNWIDTTRVGIYGHSFGGYDAAHALEAFHKTYKVAVAESGDHDWRMEKAWYPELYAGWPVDSVYEKQSNITLAPELKGKLLLIHGGIDENVNPSATFKLSEALIKAGKYFDLLIIPSARHHFSKEYTTYVRGKRWRFFVENLIKNPPR